MARPSGDARAADASSEVHRKSVHGIAWSGAQNLATSLISFGTYAILARVLPPADFGLLAFAAVFIVFLQMFVEQGIPDAIVQRSEVLFGHLNAAFWFNLVLSAALGALLWGGAPRLSTMLHEPRLAGVLRWLTPMLLLSALSGINQALLKRKLDFRRLALVNLAAALAGGVAAVCVAILHGGVWSLVAQQLAGSAVSAALLVGFGHWRPSFGFRLRELRDLLSFSFHITASGFLDFFNRRSDDFLIGYYLGPVVLGYYSLAYRLLLTFTRLITTPFNSVALSAFSRLQGNPEELRRFFGQLTRSVAAISCPIFLVLAALAPEVIEGFFGHQWQQAAPVLRILCFVGMLHSVAFLHGTLMRASGRAQWQMWFTGAGALTNVLGFLYVVRFGVLYVAGWYVLSAYFWLAADLILVKRILGHRTLGYLWTFSGPLFGGLAAAGLALAVAKICPPQWPILWRLMLEGSGGAAVLLAAQPRLFRYLLGRLEWPACYS